MGVADMAGRPPSLPAIRRRWVVRGLLLAPAAACSGVSPSGAARLAQDGEAATGRLITDVAAAARRVEQARNLVVLRAALAAPRGTTSEALRAQPGVVAADRPLVAAAVFLRQAQEALERLRDSYRAFGQIAAGRDPEAFDAMLDRASEDAEALRTLLERYATDGSEVVETLPGGETVMGLARLAGGVISRARTSRQLTEPNDAMIEVLDSLIGSAEREEVLLGPLLARIAADRGEDVVAELRRSRIAHQAATSVLDEVAEAHGWRLSPLADARLRESGNARIALGLRAIADRRQDAAPARLAEPAAGRAVLVALRDRHVALRDGTSADPGALRDSLHRFAG